MGKLHCFEETGEVRVPQSGEWALSLDGGSAYRSIGGHSPRPILRRLSDDEAKALRDARDERDKFVIAFQELLAEHEALKAKCASSPALSEVEELRGAKAANNLLMATLDEYRQKVATLERKLALADMESAVFGQQSFHPALSEVEKLVRLVFLHHGQGIANEIVRQSRGMAPCFPVKDVLDRCRDRVDMLLRYEEITARREKQGEK